MGQVFFLDRRAGEPAAAVDDLLVGEHGVVHRVPVDRTLLALDQTRGPEIQKQFLLLAVIGGIAGGEFARPVEREAHAFELGAHGLDIGVGPGGGVDFPRAGGVFRRQAEGVPAHRVEHVKAAGAVEAGDDVAQRVVAHMAHVDFAGWVGEHFQHVVFGAAGGGQVLHAEAAGLLPGGLPVRLGGGEVVAGFGGV